LINVKQTLVDVPFPKLVTLNSCGELHILSFKHFVVPKPLRTFGDMH